MQQYELGKMIGESTLYDTLKQVEKTTGETDDRLIPVEISAVGENTYFTFCKLKRGDALTYTEVYNYILLTGCILSPWEIEAVFSIDKAVEQWRLSNG